jgi:hypothetical protein
MEFSKAGTSIEVEILVDKRELGTSLAWVSIFSLREKLAQGAK